MENISVAEALKILARPAETVSLCLSKGLGAPIGAVLVGDERNMRAARRARKLLGGGMRQVGLSAAAALASLEENLERLVEDHALAANLAAGLADIPGVYVGPRPADATNMVMFKVDEKCGVSEDQLVGALRERHGVVLGYGYLPGELRAVTHKDITAEGIERALSGIRTELGLAAQDAGTQGHVAGRSQHGVAREELVSSDFDTECLTLRWADGHVSRFLHLWLRDHCPQSIHATSYQRMVDTLEIPTETKPVRVDKCGGELRIEWDTPVYLHGGEEVRESHFQLAWLRQHCYSAAERHFRAHSAQALDGRSRVTRKIWSEWSPGEGEVPRVKHAPWMTPEGFRNGMQELYRHGCLIVQGTPLTMDGTQEAAERVGVARSSFYSRGMWDTAPVDPGAVNDTAFTNLELKPHNDCSYLRDPPGIQVFNCVQQSSTGGQTWLVDGFAVADALRKEDPAAFQFFTTTPLPSQSIDTTHGVNVKMEAPIIQLDEDGSVVSFRLNNDDRSVLHDLPEASVKAFYKYLPALLRMTRSPEHSRLVRLGLGDMLIIENTRVMHGRKSFEGRRNLVGCYIDRDYYESQLRLLGFIDRKPNGVPASL